MQKSRQQNDERIENKQDVVKEMGKRTLIFLIGLVLNSLGVALVTKASLGTSPISSIPYVLSLNFPASLGMFTIFFQPFADHAANCAVKKKPSSRAAAANSGVAAVWLFD